MTARRAGTCAAIVVALLAMPLAPAVAALPARAASPVGAVAPAAAAAPAAPLAPAAAPTVDRVAGGDRWSTAIAVSQQAFVGTAPIVFLANGSTYPDALSAGPVAARNGGPLLLTPQGTLPPSVAAELTRLDPALVVIVGGTGVVAPAVENAVAALGLPVDRVAGADRYATSRALIAEYLGTSSVAYVATGAGYADALAASAAAGSVDAPVILVNGSAAALDAATRALLDTLGVTTTYIAGGTGVVSPAIEQALVARGGTVQRLAGADRYATAVAINQQAFPSATRAFIATGSGFADALAGAAYAGLVSAPLYSSLTDCVPAAAFADIESRLAVGRVTLLGGVGVLTDRVAAWQPCTALEADRLASQDVLRAAIVAADAVQPGVYSVSVRELSGLRREVSVAGAVMQEPASVMKLFAVYAVLDRIDAGTLSLTTQTRGGVSVEACLRVVIHISDNDCHWDLVALIGNAELNEQFWAEGYARTVYQGTHPGTGVYYSSKQTTTDDVALLLSRLQNGSLLSPESSARFIELLETGLWRHRIPSSVPPGIPVANKTGQLWVASGMIEADTAIVSAPNGAYVVTIIGSRNATAAGVRAISRIIYEHLNGSFGAAASYPTYSVVTTAAAAYYSSPGSGLLGTIPAGTALGADAGSRVWYAVYYGGSYVYVHHTGLRNYYDYPRRS